MTPLDTAHTASCLHFVEKCASILSSLFRRPLVKWFALCYETVVNSRLSCLSVTLVYCGQTAGWIKMPLGTEVGLGPSNIVIVLDGDPAPPPPRKGTQQPPLFGRCLLRPNGRPSQQLLSSYLRYSELLVETRNVSFTTCILRRCWW